MRLAEGEGLSSVILLSDLYRLLRATGTGVASGGWPGAAVVVVRINTDQELLVDLVQKPGQTFSVRPDSIPKVLPPEDVGPSCALDELPRDLVTRASSLGLEWQDETEEPALIPFGTAEGRVQPLPLSLAPPSPRFTS